MPTNRVTSLLIATAFEELADRGVEELVAETGDTNRDSSALVRHHGGRPDGRTVTYRAENPTSR